MLGVERIQQRPLHVLARAVGIFAGHTGFQRVAQLGNRIEAEFFGELVVHFGRLGLGDFFHRDLEARRLARKIGLSVFGRECRRNSTLVACLGAGQALLEAGNEPARADHHGSVFALAAVKLDTVDGAYEIDGDAVALVSHPAVRGLEAGGAADQIGQTLVDVGFSHFSDRTLQRDAGKVRRGDGGDHLIGHAVSKIHLAIQHLLDLGLIFGELDVRREGGALLAVIERLLRRLRHRRLHHLGHHRAAVNALQMRHRHLARPETLD